MGETGDFSYGSLPVEIDPTAWFGRSHRPALPMDAGAILDQIAGQLRAFLAGAGLSAIAVYEFPDYDLDNWWNGGAPAFLLVAYNGTRFGRPLTTSAMLQERTIEYDVHIVARTIVWPLLGPGSVYALNDGIEAALGGFRPNGCRNAYFTDERFTEQDPEGRIWDYRMTYEVVTMRPKLEPAYVLAKLRQISNLVTQCGNASTGTMTIAADGSLALPPNTVVFSVVTPAGKLARLGRDYNFAAVAGIFAITSSGLLVPNMQVQITTALVTETQTIT